MGKSSPIDASGFDELVNAGFTARDINKQNEMDDSTALSAALKKKQAQDAARKAQTDAEYQAQQAANTKNEAKYGTSDTAMLRKLEGVGSIDDKDFALLAHEDPEAATKRLDAFEQTLGMKSAGAQGATPSASGGAGIRRGTQHTADGREIPYFTNLPGDAGAQGGPMANVSGLAPYNAGPGSGGGGGGADWATSDDPVKRAVARKVAEARDVVQLGEKGEGYIGKKVAGMIPQAEKDITELGPEGANTKWLQGVEHGDYPLQVANALVSHTKEQAADEKDKQFAIQRESALTYANTHGVQNTLEALQRAEMAGDGDPKTFALLRNELTKRSTTAIKAIGSMTPSKYLPATGEDVDQWPDKVVRRDFSLTDPFKPAHMANPGGTKPIPQVAEDQQQAAQGALLDTVTTAPSIGTPAKTAYSYTAGGGATPSANMPQAPGIMDRISRAGSSAAAHAAQAGARGLNERQPGDPLDELGLPSGDDVSAFMQGLSGGEEGPLTRQQRLRREAARRARG